MVDNIPPIGGADDITWGEVDCTFVKDTGPSVVPSLPELWDESPLVEDRCPIGDKFKLTELSVRLTSWFAETVLGLYRCVESTSVGVEFSGTYCSVVPSGE